MADYPVEQILVVPTELFHRLGYFQGFSRTVERYLEELLSPRNICYRPRPEMEQDPGFKQLIPYVIFRYCDRPGAADRVPVHPGHRPGRRPAAPQTQRGHRRAHLGRRCRHRRQRQPLRRRHAPRAGRGSVHRHALHGRCVGTDQRRPDRGRPRTPGRGAPAWTASATRSAPASRRSSSGDSGRCRKSWPTCRALKAGRRSACRPCLAARRRDENGPVSTRRELPCLLPSILTTTRPRGSIRGWSRPCCPTSARPTATPAARRTPSAARPGRPSTMRGPGSPRASGPSRRKSSSPAGPPRATTWPYAARPAARPGGIPPAAGTFSASLPSTLRCSSRSRHFAAAALK